MKLEKLRYLVNENGEAHVVVEEHEAIAGDEMIGLRKGNTTFNPDAGYIHIDDGKEDHYLDADSIIYVEVPTEFPD